MSLAIGISLAKILIHIRSTHSSTFNPCSFPFFTMEIELHPAVSLHSETFNVLVAPLEMLVEALNSHLNLQRYKVLYVCGNYSRILSHLDRNFTELEVRRAFTSFQLMTVLEENHHTFLILEHDPMLYEDAKEMVEYVAQALKQTSREATILLYSPALDPHLEKMAELADRVFCFCEMPKAPAKGRAKAEPKMPGAQATLETYS
jgi:DNA polymerase I